MTPIDFTLCPRIPVRAYNGANGKKVAVLFQGEPWILKSKTRLLTARKAVLALSSQIFLRRLSTNHLWIRYWYMNVFGRCS